MQQELHAVHFPHMLRAAEAVAADVNLVRKGLRELPARRKVQVPVDILENIQLALEYRIEPVRTRVIDNGAVRNRETCP